MGPYAFIIIDEAINDLQDDHPGKKENAIRRIVGLRNSRHNKLINHLKNFDYFKLTFLEYDRIVRRLYANDIKESIEMLRELQDEIGVPYLDRHRATESAWWRFADWKVGLLNESRI